MSRLRSEFARLFLPDPLQPDATDLVDAQGRTRALVLELAAPADWSPLQLVWQGVQSDLGLPAPAIAVSGAEGLQLWFSAQAPVAVADAQRWLQALCRRYLPGIAPRRLRLFPRVDATAAGGSVVHAAAVPAQQPDPDKWSAFVAPDLVGLFVETPWLDMPPGDEGQAALLARVAVMKAGWFEAGVDAGLPAPETGREVSDDAALPLSSLAPLADQPPATAVTAGGRIEAAAFLQRVMNDEAAPLALRVEAAKALLHAPGRVGSG